MRVQDGEANAHDAAGRLVRLWKPHHGALAHLQQRACQTGGRRPETEIASVSVRTGRSKTSSKSPEE